MVKVALLVRSEGKAGKEAGDCRLSHHRVHDDRDRGLVSAARPLPRRGEGDDRDGRILASMLVPAQAFLGDLQMGAVNPCKQRFNRRLLRC